MAIIQYSSDNNGCLPGPYYSAVSASYKQGDGSMGSQLWSYLGAPTPTASTQVANAINNLGNLHYRLNTNSFVYLVHVTLYQNNFQPLKPFGYASAPVTQPTSIYSLVNWTPSQVWALQDADQKNTNMGGFPSWASSLPLNPVNGNVRITLFYDWHVEPVPVQ